MSLPPILPSVRAAGVVPYRIHKDALQVALVHRPGYDDWSWPKGKLDRGEDWAAAAVRETQEETGLVVRLGMPLPVAHYRVGGGQDKLVRYWAAQVIGGDGALEHEIDEVAWLSPARAAKRLTYSRDREQLDALVDLQQQGELETWPLLVVRHAHALPRGEWAGRPDQERPLSKVGQRRAQRIVKLLDAYAPTTILSSPSVRCTETMAPYLAQHRVSMRTRKGLSEEGYEASPAKLDKQLRRVLDRARPTALCTHGPLLPRIVDELWRRSCASEPVHRRMLARLVDVPLDKGEILACTMRGQGDEARVVAVERHRPPA